MTLGFVLVRVNSWIALSPAPKTIHEITRNNNEHMTWPRNAGLQRPGNNGASGKLLAARIPQPPSLRFDSYFKVAGKRTKFDPSTFMIAI